MKTSWRILLGADPELGSEHCLGVGVLYFLMLVFVMIGLLSEVK